MAIRHLLSLTDLNAQEVLSLIDRAGYLIKRRGDIQQSLQGKSVGIYFRKTSTRTRTSFTLGAAKLGATVITYGPHDLQVNTGETLGDTARVLSGYLDALVIRTAESLEEMRILVNQANMSVVNAMSDREHPTQALADLATLRAHFGRLSDLHVLYLGEGNSTAAALALAISRITGMRLTLLTPEGYGVPQDLLDQAYGYALQSGACIEQCHSVASLPTDVDVVYTARWQTTGSVKADTNWRTAFQPFGVTQALMARVSRSSFTVFMHDLPAVRGEEVASEVLEGPQSIAFGQAHNKLYGAMAILEWCLQAQTSL